MMMGHLMSQQAQPQVVVVPAQAPMEAASAPVYQAPVYQAAPTPAPQQSSHWFLWTLVGLFAAVVVVKVLL